MKRIHYMEVEEHIKSQKKIKSSKQKSNFIFLGKNNKIRNIDFERDETTTAIFPISYIFGSDEFEYVKPNEKILRDLSEEYIV